MSGYGNLRRRDQQRATLRRWVLTVLVVVAVLTAVFWYYNPQQRPGWLADRLPTAPEATVTVYRWRDDAGQWVIGDDPPSDREYEVVNYRHDANALPFDPAKDDN